MRRLPRPATARPTWVRLLIAVASPILATLVASLPATTNTTIAAMLYLLAVVGTAVFAGFAGGLGAAVLSFLGLNVFFTPPVGTFRVQKAEDFVALLVFLGLAGLIATLLTRARSEQARASRREQETSYLYQVATRLLAGERIEAILNQLAGDLVDLLDLAACEVQTEGPEGDRLSAVIGDAGDIEPLDIPLRTERGEFGLLRLTPKMPGAFDEFQRNLAETFAAQVALAIESSRLDAGRRSAEARAEASRIRAALFSSVTHDLKTPLASIKASATSLLDEQVAFEPRQREELLQTIVEEADRLNRLIGNLLDLSRLRAGALIPQRVATPINEVIEAVATRLRPLLSGRELKIRIRDGIPPVPIDVMQIDQVLTNLIENAIKYTFDGSEIEVAAARWHSWVEILVADRGPGIDESERSKVFDEFYRHDVGGRKAGTGLGLAIARAMVAAHGGQMWIQETPGGGTTVAFRLPIGAGQE